MSQPRVAWDRSTIGWSVDGTVLYVEHRMKDRPMSVLVPALEDWIEENDWPLTVTRTSGYRMTQDSSGTKYTYGMLEVVGPNLMQVVDAATFRNGVNRLAAEADLYTQQQIDQEEAHLKDYLAELRRQPG